MTAPSTTSLSRAAEPFRFSTSLVLEEATGLRAATLPQLLALLRTAPERCIYHHTHYFLLAHHYLTPEPTNDFVYWVTEVLGDTPLGEQLASIDTVAHLSLETLRRALVEAIETHLKRHPFAKLRFAPEGQEFFFRSSVQVVMPTGRVAWTLAEFAECLNQASIESLYFHIFDARLRLRQATNDFALWLQGQLGETALAADVAALDPYVHTLEVLRSLVVSLIHRRLSSPRAALREAA